MLELLAELRQRHNSSLVGARKGAPSKAAAAAEVGPSSGRHHAAPAAAHPLLYHPRCSRLCLWPGHQAEGRAWSHPTVCSCLTTSLTTL